MKEWLRPRPFLSSRRKIYEILILVFLSVGMYFLLGSWAALMLFNLGFVWNWAASQQVTYVLENRRYRFSLMKMVYNLHSLAQRPFTQLHPLFGVLPKILPAGFFWWLVIHFIGSDLPCWPTFLGSLFFELTQFDVYFKRNVTPVAVAEDVTENPVLEYPEDPL